MAFPAKFEGGQCSAGCGSRIHAGDMIRHDDELGAFVHDECHPLPDRYEIRADEIVCGVCWLVKPCRCDD